MRAACYLRATPEATSEGARRFATLEAQQRAFLDFCDREGFEVGPTYTELAAGDGAPMFSRLIDVLSGEQRGFTVVFAAHLDVLGDTVREQASRLFQLEAHGLPLRLAPENEQVGDPLELLLTAWQRRSPDERRRQEVREGVQRRALRGEVLGRTPYGYRTEARRLVPHPEEALVVQMIFELAVHENLGVRRIAQRLNEHGLRTRRDAPWSMVSVRGVLRNPVYTGTYRRLDVLVPRSHKALISTQLFQEAQQRLDSRRTAGGEPRRHRYLLAGRARCGYCQNRLIGITRATRAGHRAYYQCESRTNRSICDYHTRRAEDLESEVHRVLLAAQPDHERASDDPSAREPALREGGPSAVLPQALPPAPPVLDDAGRAGVEARRAALRRDLERLLDRGTHGQLTGGQLRERGAAVAAEDLELERREAAAAARRELLADAAQRGQLLAAAHQRLAKDWQTLPFETRRALLHEVVQEIIVTDHAIEVQFSSVSMPV